MNQLRNLFRRVSIDEKCLDNKDLGNQERSELTNYIEDICFIKPLHPYTFKIPQLYEILPEILSSLKKNQSEILHIGILECGTISSFFEDSWNKLFEELKKSIKNSQENESEWIKLISNAYLKRDWHRIWLVRCFMSICWELYIKDILILDKNRDYDYLMLPCYSHSCKKVEKIPIGELLCITANFLLDYLNPQIEIPLSTIRGVPILKKVIYYNKSKYWKTPPPFCVAKVALLENSIIKESNLENISKYIKAEIWISLNIDNPKIYWIENYNNTTTLKLPADNQTFASCIRVLRKDEIGIFRSPFKNYIYSTFTLKLLDWYLEDTLTINYGNYILECPIIVKNYKIGNSTNETGIEINYNISFSDSLNRRFLNGKIIYENNKLPRFIIKIIEKYRNISLPLIYQLLKNELGEPENFTCCRHLLDAFQMILSTINSNELYYIHLEINVQTIIQYSEISLFYILRHLNEYKYLCDYKCKFLDDLYNFGFFVISKLKTKQKYLFIQDIYIILVTDINIIKKLRILFHELLNLTKNWFEVPFVLIENDTILKSNSNEEFIYIITPSINKVQELIFYTFPGTLSVKSNPILMKLLLENYSFSINDKFKQINSIVYNDIFSFINGKTLIEDLGQLEICIWPEDSSFSLSSNSVPWLFESIDTQQILLSEDIGRFCYLIKSCLLILYFNYNTHENNRNLFNISVSSLRRWSQQIFLINSKKIPKYYLIFGKYIEIIFKVYILGSIGYEDIIVILDYMVNKKYKTEERNVIQLCLNYVISWIFIQIKNTDLIRHSNKNDEQLKLKDFIQSIYKIHRISRIELSNIKYQTLHHIIMEPVLWLPINPYEIGNKSNNKLAFFEKLIKFEIFNILFRLLISPIYANNIFKDDKFSIIDKRQSNYKLVSFGSNKLGYLGIGPPRISIFREIECKLYPNLYDINCIYKNMGIELESSENEIQDIVLNLKVEEQIFKKISCGLNHIIVLCKNGSLLSWGSNLYGQCAHNTQNSNLNLNNTNIENIHREIINEYNQMIPYPKKIYSISKLTEPVSIVTCGALFTMILDSKGRVFTWGYGKDGCLGTGNLQSTSIPSLVSFNYPIKKISAGMFHCSAIDINCRLYIWGSNEAGQIGLALRETEDELPIIKIPQEICIEFVIEKVESPMEIKNIIILYHHTYNFDRTKIIKWSDISLGEAHSVGLDTDGLVWVWGQNNFNQLSSIPNLISPKLILRYIDHSKKDKIFFLNSKEKIVEFPIPLAEFILPSIKLFDNQKITKVICGSTTSCAIDEQGKLWMWGLVHSGIIENSIDEEEYHINNISKVMYKEIPLPKKVFKNILIEDKTIKLLRFGQGTNNLIIVTGKERCYIWLNTNISKNFKKSLFDSVIYNEHYGCLTIDCNKNWIILDVSTVSDSIIMIMKKKKL